MSLCQSKNTSCGACCGIFNLDLNKIEINNLINHRTSLFKSEVDLKKNWTIAEYRKKREIEESSVLRKDETTYVCPFLGFIKDKKIGCMIHPSITGDPLSQNFSFYGSSICQGYECKNKERSDIKLIEDIIIELNIDSYYEYSNIFSDHITLNLIIEFFNSCGYDIEKIIQKEKELFFELLNYKFKKGILLNQTSFEFEEVRDLSILDRLLFRLSIDNKEDIYFKILEISKTP
jgi:hypothetical protein